MKTPRDHSIGAQMFIAVTLLRRRMSRAIGRSGYDITIEQLAVLESLYFHGDLSMSEISKMTFKENANITHIIDKLENKKFVKRLNKPGDRRSYLITLTDEGKKVFDRIVPTIVQELKDATSTISEAENKELLRIVSKIIAENNTE